MKTRTRDFGAWRKPVEAFELYESHLDRIEEGTGGPEGRADFPNYMLTILRTKVAEGWQFRASNWERWMGKVEAVDLRQHTLMRLNELSGIGPSNEFGEYNRLSSAEEVGPSYVVGKHGGIYGLTQEMLINDPASVILNRTPTEIGKAMGRYVTQAIIAFLESNPTYIDSVAFFHASHGNNATSTAAVPNETNLATIISAMKSRRVRNMPIEINPETILVRDDITKLIFNRIITSQITQQVQTTAATFDKGNVNPVAGIVPNDAVIVEPWLNDADDWYVFANAQDRPAFVVASLKGHEQPFVGLKNPEVASIYGGEDPYAFEIDTIDYKIKHFFGLAANEPFAAYRAQPT